MERYGNFSGTSGIRAYELRQDAIVVEFRRGGCYLYDHTKPGAHHVAAMRELAVAGSGLNAYINRHVRGRYARKLW